MPVIYYNIDELKCLERDPYKVLTKLRTPLRKITSTGQIEQRFRLN